MTRLGLKIAVVIVIAVALLIPLALIHGLIRERTRYRAEARADIARSWTGAQEIVGPLLAVPPSRPADDAGKEHRRLFVTPETLEIQAALRTESRKRGLYSVPVYHTRISIEGEFDLAEVARAGAVPWTDFDLDEAFLVLSLTDNRGIVHEPTLSWNGDLRDVESGAMVPLRTEGVHAAVGPLDPDNQTRYPFRVELELRGMETLRFAPVGKDTWVAMDAEWPHPSFIGRFLPVEYEVDDERFAAEWRVSGLASGRQAAWVASRDDAAAATSNALGVSLINPVDIYQQATRAVKYGNLIVMLTFATFFLVEMIRRLMLHPIQYLFVGLALVVFFLLLLALSEYMTFGLAYLIAATACVGLIAIYTTAALGNTSNGVSVTATLAGLYGMLFVILKAEESALLMGSLLLFLALAAAMLVTRRINWYRLDRQLQHVNGAIESNVGD